MHQSSASRSGFKTPAAKAVIEIDITSEQDHLIKQRQEISLDRIEPEKDDSKSNKKSSASESSQSQNSLRVDQKTQARSNYAIPDAPCQHSNEKPLLQTPFERQYKEYLNRVLQAQMSTSKLTESRKAKLLNPKVNQTSAAPITPYGKTVNYQYS